MDVSTGRTADVLRLMLADPGAEFTAAAIAAAVSAHPATILSVLRRLADEGVVETWTGYPGGVPEAPGAQRKRVARFTPGGARRAREALTRYRDALPRPPGRRPATDDGERVWTVAELRAEYQVGRMSRPVWLAILRELRRQGIKVRYGAE